MSKLLAQMEGLERQKAEMLAHLTGWSTARLNFSPEPGSWTAMQVLDHLEKTERGIAEAARNHLGTPHRIGLRDRVGGIFVDRIFQSKRRVKVPASAARVLPSAQVELSDVLARWDESRRTLAQTVAGLTPNQLEGGVFRHTIAGWKNWPQVLRFFSVHLTHHEYQLDRLRTGSEGLTAS